MVDIKGLDKADVLLALWGASREMGSSGSFGNPNKEPLTKAEAQRYVEMSTYFDYVKGRVIKCDLAEDSFNPRLFDRDNGAGAALRAIETLRQ